MCFAFTHFLVTKQLLSLVRCRSPSLAAMLPLGTFNLKFAARKVKLYELRRTHCDPGSNTNSPLAV